MKSLQCPIAHTNDTVHIFGTNFDVDIFNHDMLQKMNGVMSTYYANDKGVKKLLKVSSSSRVLALKPGCRVIITHNLANGLVNGLTARVTKLHEDKIQVKVDEDPYLNHGMDGNIYDLEKFNFNICDIEGKIIACRKQFPIKLGYATTVDRSQGRTIPSLVVDAYNFWKPAQLGVAVG